MTQTLTHTGVWSGESWIFPERMRQNIIYNTGSYSQSKSSPGLAVQDCYVKIGLTGTNSKFSFSYLRHTIGIWNRPT